MIHTFTPHPVFQIRIDVTVSGSIFSGDGLYYAHSTLPSALAEDNYVDYVVDATFATYTVVQEVRTLRFVCAIQRRRVHELGSDHVADLSNEIDVL